MLDDRKLDVLRAIVEDYVATHEPVGSKTLVDRHNLGVSPATVRNDMAALEEEGYITQPHTSAGRIPTDEGYRLFVDKLSTVKPLSPAEKTAIASFLTARSTSTTSSAAPSGCSPSSPARSRSCSTPRSSGRRVRHIELVTLAPRRRAAGLLITSTGRVEQRIVELPDDVDEQLIADLRSRLNTALRRSAARPRPPRLADVPRRSRRPTAAGADRRRAARGVHRRAREERDRGRRRRQPDPVGDDFDATIKPVLEAIEEQVVLLKLLGEATNAALTVRIGHENRVRGAGEHVCGRDRLRPGRGGAGHTRHRRPDPHGLPDTMARRRAVARYVSRILADDDDPVRTTHELEG